MDQAERSRGRTGQYCAVMLMQGCLDDIIISARVRSMREGNVFTDVCLLTGGYPWSLVPCPFRGLCSQVLSGGGEYPIVLSLVLSGGGRRGTPILSCPGGGYTPILSRAPPPLSPAITGYAAGGMTLAVTQEDFRFAKLSLLCHTLQLKRTL